MRILLPTIRDPGQIGGTTTHITMLAAGLERAGHDVHALYLGAKVPELGRDLAVVWPAGLFNRVRTGWGMMYAADVRGRLLAAVTAREMAAASPPWEVLNAQEVYSVPYLRPVADRFGVPLVLTLHGYPLFESDSEGYTTESEMGRSFLMRAEMKALRLADAVVTVDSRLYRHALSLVPERSDSVYTLMNFLDTDTFSPPADDEEGVRLRLELREAWDVPQDKIVLFCPRRLVKKNGVVYPSLALAGMTPAECNRFLLLHAGEGGERDEIERIIRENGLHANVRLLGGQGPEAILELYRLADVVLVPSVYSENVEEATSLSALEAMASGRPLIAGDVGGLAEMVVDGETGLLVPADAEALAAAMLRLADDPDLGARLAAAARTYVVDKHSHVGAATAYAEIYAKTAADVEARAAAEAAGGRPAALPDPVSVKGFVLHPVSLEEAAGWVVATAAAPAVEDRVTRAAVSFNPELIMRAENDPLAAEALLEADLAYPDGVGAVWAAGRQGIGPLERVPGIDLAQRILELAAEQALSVYFLGAADGVAEQAAACQADRLPGLVVAGAHHGYFSADEEEAVVRRVRESRADILLVALGAPRQEIFIHRHRRELGAAVALGIGGSFDVWAGVVERAPEWIQQAKMEWFYRLVADPRRAGRQAVLAKYALGILRGCPDDYGPQRRGRARAAKDRDRDS